MSTKTILVKIGGATASLVSVFAFSTPARAFTFTTFTDEASFRLEAGSLSTETFNSFTADASFNNAATVILRDFSLTGFGNVDSRNLIDAPFLVNPNFDINGTSFVLGAAAFEIGFIATFNSSITAFGATFNGTSDFVPSRLRVGSDVVGNLPTITQGTSGFFGFIAHSSFTTLTFEVSDTGFDAFSADNFLYSSITPIPFEFSPALGLGALGSLWAAKRLIEKSKKN